MRPIFGILLIAIIACSCRSLLKTGEKKISVFKTTSVQNDTIVHRMLESCRIVLRVNSITSGRGSREGFPIYYIGLAGRNSFAVKLKQEKGQVNGIWTITGSKDTARLSSLQVNDILKLFKSKGWDLNYNDVDTAVSYCLIKSIEKGKPQPCETFDGQTYFLKSYTKKGYAGSALYAPDFYEKECCQGNINRINFLLIKKLIDDLWKKKR